MASENLCFHDRLDRFLPVDLQLEGVKVREHTNVVEERRTPWLL